MSTLVCNRTALLHHARALRDAREETARDHESTAAFIAIERLGTFLRRDPTATLGETTCCLTALLMCHPPQPAGTRLTEHETLVQQVKQSRNDRMHAGPTGRRAAQLATELAVRLEGALMANANCLTAKDIMASPVETAEDWQTLYELRRTLLARGYSSLPWRNSISNSWHLVTSGWILDRIGTGRRKDWAGRTLAEAARDEEPPKSSPKHPNTPITCLGSTTTLIVEGSYAVGIITPTDLLAVH